MLYKNASCEINMILFYVLVCSLLMAELKVSLLLRWGKGVHVMNNTFLKVKKEREQEEEEEQKQSLL